MASWWGKNQLRGREIDPEDIFLDSSNMARLNAQQLEGRIERPVSTFAIVFVGVLFAFVALVYAGQAFNLQILKGKAYADISRNNRLDRSVLFATRGIITDRSGTELAWNEPQEDVASSTTPFALRSYTGAAGFSHLLGFIRYPKADASGEWWREEYTGVAGAEHFFNDILAGQNGSLMSETDARGKLVREDIVDPPKNGDTLKLSIDASLQTKLEETLANHAKSQGFQGGAGVIMDVHTGELLSLVSFPEYDNAAFGNGDSDAIAAANANPAKPLLDRAVAGVYAPGSIVKPIFAAAGLQEGIITPETQIFSSGQLELPNPYDPNNPSIFKDWKAHGLMDLRHAIAVSSDVYFYEVGGGFGAQKGLGIAKIDEYARKFGLGSATGFRVENEADGTIPTPEWKAKVFNGDPWRIGDTYHTAIGQYGFQVTPLQVVRYVAAIANGGRLMTPQIVADGPSASKSVGISDANLQVVREGMRMAVHSQYTDRTERALDMDGIDIAGKTGTAQIGVHNENMNSWAIGFWPYENPKYAFAVVLEKGPAGTLSGAAPAMTNFFYWLRDTKPEYVSH